jgi:hypothetical protein
MPGALSGWSAIGVVLPVLVGVSSGIVGPRLWGARSARHDVSALRVRSLLVCVGLLFTLWPTMGIALRDRGPDGALFFRSLGGRWDYQLLVAFVVSVVSAWPTGAAIDALPWSKGMSLSQGPQRSSLGRRSYRLQLILAVAIGAFAGWSNYFATTNYLLVEPGTLKSRGFMDCDEVSVDATELKRVLYFDRRRGVIGRGRQNPHLVIETDVGRIDTFSLAKNHVEELEVALGKAFPHASVERFSENMVSPTGTSLSPSR